MPKPATHTLLWSAQSKTYALLCPDAPPQSLVPGNEEPWLAWLTTHSSFSFQGAIRSSQCAQGVPATRRGLLVCLPHQREPNPQALSRTNRDGDPGALRAGSTRTQQLALAFLSGTGTSSAVV